MARARKKPAAEGVYTPEELAAAASCMKGSPNPDCVSAALKVAGVTSCTRKEAEEILQSFLNREVN